MHRTAAILAAFLMIPMLVAGVPEAASAQTFKLRLWSTPTSSSLSGEPNGPSRVRPQNYLDSLVPGNIVWDSLLLGFEFRSRPINGFIWSLSYDTGGVNNLVDNEGGFGSSPGTNRFFSTNVHYLIAPANWRGAEVTVFAGYGNGFLEVAESYLGTRAFSASGLRYGLDLYVPFREAWYLSGSAAFGSWSVNHIWGGVLDPPGGTASIRDYNLALGRMLSPEAGLEVGYRSSKWSTTSVGSTPCPCTMAWDGWYAAITMRRK